VTNGRATYIRLKVHLIQQGRKLTEFAVSIGTSTQQVQATVQNYAGSDRLPSHPISQKILEAVAVELGDTSILPVAKVKAGAEDDA
jgi:hypothetical protein